MAIERFPSNIPSFIWTPKVEIQATLRDLEIFLRELYLRSTMVSNNHADVLEGLGVPPTLPSFEVSSLPLASENPQGLIYVSDETGGPTLAFSDGTNWLRVQDRAVVS